MSDDSWDEEVARARARGKPPGNPTTLFSQLSDGKTIGKKVNAFVFGVGTDNDRVSPINILELRGPDSAAQNVQLTIVPPMVLPVGGAGQITVAQGQDVAARQQASGTIDFFQNEKGNAHVDDSPWVAVLDWGIGGGTTGPVEVDVHNGLCVNLTCSYLRVSMSLDPLYNVTFFTVGTSAVYELGAFVGPGYAKPNNAQRSLWLPGVPAIAFGVFGTSQVVPIPKFATRCTLAVGVDKNVSPTTVLGWLAQLVFFDGYGATSFGLNPNPAADWDIPLASYTVADNGNGGKGFPIPNRAKYVAVLNQSAFAINAMLIFELGI